jgi:hydrogenase maturation factor
MDDDASHGSPGTDLVPLSGARVVPRELALAADLALGVGARTVRVALRLGGASLGAARLGGRVASALPGAGLARRAASSAARPLVADGARARDRAVERAQEALERVVPAIVELIDVDAIVRRVDVDALVATVDVDALLRRTDVDTLLQRVDVDAFLAGVDLDTLIGRIDVDAIAARIDVNAIVQEVDIDAIVEETELGTIVARSTSGFASEALDAARAQTVSADTLVTRIVDRVLRRRAEGPLGPPLLVRQEDELRAAESAAAGSAPAAAPAAGPPPPAAPEPSPPVTPTGEPPSGAAP